MGYRGTASCRTLNTEHSASTAIDLGGRKYSSRGASKKFLKKMMSRGADLKASSGIYRRSTGADGGAPENR